MQTAIVDKIKEEIMDTSEKYIKMCKEAKGIQKQYKYEAGNFFYCPEDEECIVFPPMYHGWTSKKYIWLPRQDQLQEMIIGYGGGYFSSVPLGSGHKWMTWDNNQPLLLMRIASNFMHYSEVKDYFKSFLSVEQLWLAFVMKEKCNKEWDEKNEKWIGCKK